MHEVTHTGKRPFYTNCNKAFFGVECCLQRHMRIRTEKQPYSCTTCGKLFLHGLI